MDEGGGSEVYAQDGMEEQKGFQRLITDL